MTEKRKEIRRVILETLRNKDNLLSENFRTTYKVMKTEALFEETTLIHANGWNVTELFELREGVTWGGEGCESVFVVDESVASTMEKELTPRTIGGRNVRPGRITWNGEHLVFPYVALKQKWVPAFHNPQLGIDSLDFEVSIDELEKGKTHEYKLKARTAQKYVAFPNVAEYLFGYYDILSKRVFKERPLADYRKMWYEYIWQRDPSILKIPKIVCPRLTPEARFAVDKYGYIPRDSVRCLIPKNQLESLIKTLSKIANRPVSMEICLNYVLAFLNSQAFNDLLAAQRAKKRGGYPIVGEKMLKRFIIPRPEPKYHNEIGRILNGSYEQRDIDGFYT
jgi:hypothetical protein